MRGARQEVLGARCQGSVQNLVEQCIRFEFRPYARLFRRPLQTSHGEWTVREGILLRLMDAAGRVGWGEIAPIPWFGSETLAAALEFCRQLPATITRELIFSIPDHLPACQFGFESAWEEVEGLGARGWGLEDGEDEGDGEMGRLRNAGNFQSAICNLQSTISYSILLPAGKAALRAWEEFWQRGDRTFKMKIGVGTFEEELRVFEALVSTLPAIARLRLDANGGLSVQQAIAWLEVCKHVPKVEFLEQPLPPGQFGAIRQLAEQYPTAIALDESVATLSQLRDCYQQGWRGVFVIKPAIAGSPSRLRQFCRGHAIDAVFSSAFETAIGRQAGLRLAAELGNRDRAMGYGTTHWFDRAESEEFDQLWQTL